MLANFFENYMLANFLEPICWENFWKLYAGNFFGNCMLENSGGYQRLFEGVIMAMLWYNTTV